MRVYDNDGEELLSGTLGTTINSDLVFKCLPEDIIDDGSVCMEWMHRLVSQKYLPKKFLTMISERDCIYATEHLAQAFVATK